MAGVASGVGHMGVRLSVQMVRGGQGAQTYRFDSSAHKTLKIGRLSTVQLCLDDPRVSRIHAVIDFAGQDVSLTDMGSTSGTLVNGARVQKVKLNHGDQVVVGDTTLVIGLHAPRPIVAAAPPPAPAPAPAPAAAPALASAPAPAPAPALASARRVTDERLEPPAVASGPMPRGIARETRMTAADRILEMRIYWGETLLSMQHYPRPAKVTIGENKRTDVFVSSEGLPVDVFPLIRTMHDEYVLTFTDAMAGEVEMAGESRSLASARASSWARSDDALARCYQLRMPPETRAIVHWGGVTFAFRFVPPSRPIPKEWFQNIDLPYLNVLVSSFFLHLAVLVTLLVYPYDVEALRADLFAQSDRFASLILEAPKETKSTRDTLAKIQRVQEHKQEEMREKPPPGSAATDLLKKKPAIKADKSSPATGGGSGLRREAVARQFSKLFDRGGGNLLGGGGGGSISGSLAGVIGTAGEGSASAGLAGLQIRGSGPLTGGGVGTSVGIGGIGTQGRLGGGGIGYGSGVGMGQRKERELISLETPVVLGALPPEVIKKVIDQNRNQIRYCYEVQLQRQQDLEGRILVRWLIGATGAVIKADVRETTMNNAAVEQCILSKIREWKFPTPAGGGVVEVNFPFVFQAT